MFFVQFCLDVDRSEVSESTGKTVGLDMGLKSFYTDNEGNSVPCPQFLRKAEKQLKRAQRQLSKKQKGSHNRRKARVKLARRHLKVQRQRKDFACKLANACEFRSEIAGRRFGLRCLHSGTGTLRRGTQIAIAISSSDLTIWLLWKTFW